MTRMTDAHDPYGYVIRVNGIPLGEAAMCLDDETVFNLRDRVCPRCASGVYVLLETFLQARA